MFEADGSKHPADDSECSQINSRGIIGSLSLSFDPRDSSDDLPNDVISSDFRLADSVGEVWSMQSRFTSKIFVIHMIDLSSSEPDLFPITSADDKFKEAYQKARMPEDVRFSYDDRFYRRLLLGNDIL